MSAKRIYLFLVFLDFFFLPCQVGGQERNKAPFQWTFQEKEYTLISPESLCPFTVEVYPEVLYVGDPLYVHMNFRNNTDKDTYAYAVPIRGTGIEYFVIEFYLKHGFREMIPWSVANLGGYSDHVWQKIKPEEEGVTQYMSLGFPNVRCGEMGFLDTGNFSYRPTHVKEWWETIRKSGNTLGTAGQLVVVLNNGGHFVIPKDADRYFVPPKQLQTIVSVSSPITIKPRPLEEMDILEETFVGKGRPQQKRDLERIIPQLTPGPLQNLLKYQLMLLELRDGVLDGESKISGEEVLEMLENIERFLKPLHEIERENLKLHVGDVFTSRGGRHWIENIMKKYGEEHWTKFNEVFGKEHPFVELPPEFRTMRVSTATTPPIRCLGCVNPQLCDWAR